MYSTHTRNHSIQLKIHFLCTLRQCGWGSGFVDDLVLLLLFQNRQPVLYDWSVCLYSTHSLFCPPFLDRLFRRNNQQQNHRLQTAKSSKINKIYPTGRRLIQPLCILYYILYSKWQQQTPLPTQLSPICINVHHHPPHFLLHWQAVQFRCPTIDCSML